MNKYERNIKQIRERGESAEMYFLDKTQEECGELNFAAAWMQDVVNKASKENLYEEIADVLNCIEYLTILFNLDRDKIDSIRNYKLDRGYESGEAADD